MVLFEQINISLATSTADKTLSALNIPEKLVLEKSYFFLPETTIFGKST